MDQDLLELVAGFPPLGDEQDIAYDRGRTALEGLPPLVLTSLVESLWRMDPRERGEFEALCFKHLPPAGTEEREPMERSFWQRALAMTLEGATRVEAPVDPALIGEMWKAGRERTTPDPFLDRVVLDACRRFKALDAVPDLIQEGMLVEAAAIDWSAALRRLPTLAVRAEEGLGLSVVPDLPDTRAGGNRFRVITDIYRMMVIALPQHRERAGLVGELLRRSPEEARLLFARSAYFGLSRAQVVTRLPSDEVGRLMRELETAWRDAGYPASEFGEIESAYMDGLKLEDRYFDSLYRK